MQRLASGGRAAALPLLAAGKLKAAWLRRDPLRDPLRDLSRAPLVGFSVSGWV